MNESNDYPSQPDNQSVSEFSRKASEVFNLDKLVNVGFITDNRRQQIIDAYYQKHQGSIPDSAFQVYNLIHDIKPKYAIYTAWQASDNYQKLTDDGLNWPVLTEELASLSTLLNTGEANKFTRYLQFAANRSFSRLIVMNPNDRARFKNLSLNENSLNESFAHLQQNTEEIRRHLLPKESEFAPIFIFQSTESLFIMSTSSVPERGSFDKNGEFSGRVTPMIFVAGYSNDQVNTEMFINTFIANQDNQESLRDMMYVLVTQSTPAILPPPGTERDYLSVERFIDKTSASYPFSLSIFMPIVLEQ